MMSETGTRAGGVMGQALLVLVSLMVALVIQRGDVGRAVPAAAPSWAAAAPAAGGLRPLATPPARIGLQAGHWRTHELPAELARLRTASGGSGGGVREVDLNLAVTQRVAERLRADGHTVDILPATVPPGYRADVLLAIHADATTSPSARGYKLARSRFSRLPVTDDRLVATVREAYGQATGLPLSLAVTRNMTGYYAFNHRRFEHAIHPTTAAAILEMGYLTNATDRALLTGATDRVVDGIVHGLGRFVASLPPSSEREPLQPARPLDCRIFPETDQEVCGPFRWAWENQGGLARFGLPISPELVEADPESGREQTVQYFERARLEHLPEAASLADEIRSGLVGRLVTADRRSEPVFRPIVDPGDGSWFAETGHTLRHGFRAYWWANGGLAVFGYPISEEFVERNPEDGRDYVVQYFERARLEHHPEQRGSVDEFQRGQLGRQLYRLRMERLS